MTMYKLVSTLPRKLLLTKSIQLQNGMKPLSCTALNFKLHYDDTQNAARRKAMGKGNNRERTFIAIKPDGVQRGLVGKIIARFEEKGFKLVAMKMEHASEEHLKKHYADLSSKPFFNGLVNYMSSGPLVAMVWEGLGAVATGRVMLGETNPADSKPGTIRGDYCIEVGRNICHGSDSVESANKEIALWFKDSEITNYNSCAESWIYE